MAKYGAIEISDTLSGAVRRCSVCKKLILVEERYNGSCHTMAQIASHWDCLTPEQQQAAALHYGLTEVV